MELVKVTYEQKFVLRNLMELYQYDMTEFEDDGHEMNEYGLFDYKYIDHYWTEEGRYPYFIMESGNLAGFALIREISNPDSDTKTYSMAEFFVLKKYRKRGFGRNTAIALFDQFKGEWVVAWLKTNIPAMNFWTKIITAYSKNNCYETTHGGNPALRFRSS